LERTKHYSTSRSCRFEATRHGEAYSPPAIVVDNDDHGSSEEDDDEALHPGPWKIISVVSKLFVNVLAMAIGWLHSTSTYF